MITDMKEQKQPIYYLVGCGKGDLAASEWKEQGILPQLTMTHQMRGTADAYSITVALCAGDAFQICHDASWEGQIGIGFMDGVAFCHGIDPHHGCTYLPRDQMLASVRDAEGNTVFYGYNEFYRSYKTWNITLGEGMDGTYRLTYISYPKTPSFNRLLWERIGP